MSADQLSAAVALATSAINAKETTPAQLAEAKRALERSLRPPSARGSAYAPHAWHVLGLLYHQDKNHSKAITCINNGLKALSSMGGLPDTFMLNNLGEAYRASGDGETARKCYYRAIEAGRRPGTEESAEALAWNNLGLLEIATGKVEHAREFAERALELKPDLEQAILLRKTCESRMTAHHISSNAGTTQRNRGGLSDGTKSESGTAQHGQKRKPSSGSPSSEAIFLAASTALARIDKRNPQYHLSQAELFMQVGETHRQTGAHNSALHAFDSVVSILSNSAVDAESTTIKSSEMSTQIALLLMNGIAAGCMELISLQRFGEAFSRGRRQLIPACELVGGSQGAWPLCVVGSKFSLWGEPSKAVYIFEQALRLDGNGKACSSDGEVCQELEGRGAASVAALTFIGDILFQGSLQRKEKYRSITLQKTPENCNFSSCNATQACGLNSGTRLSSREDRWSLSENYFRAALKVDENFLDATASLAEVLRMRGDLAGACKMYRRACMLENGNVHDKGEGAAGPTASNASLDTLFNYAQCLECMGNVEAALAVVLPLAESLLLSDAQNPVSKPMNHCRYVSSSLPVGGDPTRLSDHAIVLLYLKLRFVAGQANAEIAQLMWDIGEVCRAKQPEHQPPEIILSSKKRTNDTNKSSKKQSHNRKSKEEVTLHVSTWDRLLSVVGGWSKQVEFAIRKKLPTHWAYALFIRKLQRLHGSPSGAPCDALGALQRYNHAHTQWPAQKGVNKEDGGGAKKSHMLTAPSHSLVYTLLGAQSQWLPIVGDSHCLSLAWTRLMVEKSAGARSGASLGKERVATESPVVVPFVVTGLQGWHMQDGYKFVTSSNLDYALEKVVNESHFYNICKNLEFLQNDIDNKGERSMSVRLPNGEGLPARGDLITCLFCAGEIDCRQGIVGALMKGKHGGNEGAAVKETVQKMVAGLESRARKYGIRFLVLPVALPTDTSKLQHARLVHNFNTELASRIDGANESDSQVVFLDWMKYCQAWSHSDQILADEFNADGTHLNRKVVPLVAKAYWNSQSVH